VYLHLKPNSLASLHRGSQSKLFPCFENRKDSRTRSRSSARVERKRSESVCGIKPRTRRLITAELTQKWPRSLPRWLRDRPPLPER